MKTKKMMAIVAEGKRGRVFVAPSPEQVDAADCDRPDEYPSGSLFGKAQVNIGLYGMTRTSDLFTNRQLTALTMFSNLVGEAQKKAEADALDAGLLSDGVGIDNGGTGARAYGEAIGVYLANLVDQLANHNSSICSWHTGNTQLRNVFSRQAIPMTWDYAESNPFCSSSGCFDNLFARMVEALCTEERRVCGV